MDEQRQLERRLADIGIFSVSSGVAFVVGRLVLSLFGNVICPKSDPTRSWNH